MSLAAEEVKGKDVLQEVPLRVLYPFCPGYTCKLFQQLCCAPFVPLWELPGWGQGRLLLTDATQ